MCMLCVIPPHVIPSREKLENSALNNPDGFGFAIVIPKERRIHVERTMNADTSINRFLEMRGKYPEGYATWHARLATHGTVNVDNCHPFQVGSADTYLAHNGILPVTMSVGEKRSDTRVFAEDFLAQIGGAPALDNEQVWNVIEDFTNGSKVVVLTVNPDAKQQMYLFHEEKGNVDESGVWWSNNSCELSAWSGYRGTNTWRNTNDHYFYDYDDEFATSGYGAPAVLSNGYDGKPDFSCSACLTRMTMEEVEDNEWICPMCFTCQMCDQDKVICLCYRPKGKRVQYENLSEVPQSVLDKVRMSAGRYEAAFNFGTEKWETVEVQEELYLPTKSHTRAVTPIHTGWELS